MLRRHHIMSVYLQTMLTDCLLCFLRNCDGGGGGGSDSILHDVGPHADCGRTAGDFPTGSAID